MFRSVWTGATYLDENYAGLHGDVRPGRYAFDHLVVTAAIPSHPRGRCCFSASLASATWRIVGRSRR
jgi:hypothetical protein